MLFIKLTQFYTDFPYNKEDTVYIGTNVIISMKRGVFENLYSCPAYTKIWKIDGKSILVHQKPDEIINLIEETGKTNPNQRLKQLFNEADNLIEQHPELVEEVDQEQFERAKKLVEGVETDDLST